MNRCLLAKILFPIVLLTQVAAGFSPGRSLCVMFEACCGHHVHADGSSHAHDDCHAHLHGHGHDHGHDGPCEDSCPETCAETCEETCEGSTCHLHVALPDDTEMVRERVAGTPTVETVAWPPTPPAPCLPEVTELAKFPRWEPPPDAWPACGERKAIETDSLLI